MPPPKASLSNETSSNPAPTTSSSSPIAIRRHPTKGRALYATTSFTPSTTISSFSPLLLLPTLANLTTTCTYCLRPGSPKPCSRCHAVFYCDAACQSADWKVAHGGKAGECKALRRVPEGRRTEIPTPVRALMRMMLVKGMAEAVGELEGHVEKRRAADTEGRDLQVMAMGACSFADVGSGIEEVNRAVELLCKIHTNAFYRNDPDVGEVGIFLEPTLAMANHSCTPNALVHFIGRKAVLRAETSIKAGDEIEISYIDYNNSLPKRRKALSHFHFQCQCPRCRDDLNVYQVCASSPIISLNAQNSSVVTDTSLLRNPPSIHTTEKLTEAQTLIHREASRETADLFDPQQLPASLPERRTVLRDQYRRCEGLTKAELWAITPLPQVLTETAIYLSENGDFASALAVACHVSTACDPFRFVAPFHPARVKGLATIAKLLANTAADTAASLQSTSTITTSTFVSKAGQTTVEETLRDIDQVSLCQMLLIMILSTARGEEVVGWDIFIEAKSMLSEIEQLPGREREKSLIKEWQESPGSDRSQAFFEYAVVKQVNALAILAPSILVHEFA